MTFLSQEFQKNISTATMASPMLLYENPEASFTTIQAITSYIFGIVLYSESNKAPAFIPQFFSLDLTKSGWTISNPLWKAATYPPASVLCSSLSESSKHFLSVSRDIQSFSV
ncbi:MAG: hypothetical protein J3R72DRAFT_425367 [Linnemannia gamsii]|nr:MAG: hypothetical protein J3R72DRAFT_425367 [Linnemannia gamsii]